MLHPPQVAGWPSGARWLLPSGVLVTVPQPPGNPRTLTSWRNQARAPGGALVSSGAGPLLEGGWEEHLQHLISWGVPPK